MNGFSLPFSVSIALSAIALDLRDRMYWVESWNRRLPKFVDETLTFSSDARVWFSAFSIFLATFETFLLKRRICWRKSVYTSASSRSRSAFSVDVTKSNGTPPQFCSRRTNSPDSASIEVNACWSANPPLSINSVISVGRNPARCINVLSA